MQYSIARNLEYKEDCHRCNRPLMVAVRFVSDGKLISVGRCCAKHYGITWTPKVGPLANDAKTYNSAVEIFRKLRYNTNHKIYPRWPEGWQIVKDELGSLAWKRASYEAMM